jgi:hypothetical protein
MEETQKQRVLTQVEYLIHLNPYFFQNTKVDMILLLLLENKIYAFNILLVLHK